MSTPSPIGGPHTHAKAGVSWVMWQVVLALTPTTLFGLYLFGWPALNLLVLTVLSAVAAEALGLRLASKPLRPFVTDGSAALTGLLLALSLPPYAPWWISVLGSFFAIIIGKQVFGGLGQNIFNPAMLARVALLISFPVEMTTWADPSPLFSGQDAGFLHGLAVTFIGTPTVDFVSGASVLGHVKTELTAGHSVAEALLSQHFMLNTGALGFMRGSLGETSSLLILLGGLYLMARRIITWHIPVSMLAAVAVMSTAFYVSDSQHYLAPSVHLLSGGVMLGAFFIATDMVTSPSTPKGQLIFGAGCGVLVYLIRTWGGYPEGVGFAVLLVNALTPLIDHYLRPRIYGRTRAGEAIRYSPRQIGERMGDHPAAEKDKA